MRIFISQPLFEKTNEEILDVRKNIIEQLWKKFGKDIEIIGFLKGYQGLMYEKYKKMSLSDFEDILNVGGTILGSSRCPFKKMRVIEDGFDKVEAMKKTYRKLKK